jgi:hypothetical protein
VLEQEPIADSTVPVLEQEPIADSSQA